VNQVKDRDGCPIFINLVQQEQISFMKERNKENKYNNLNKSLIRKVVYDSYIFTFLKSFVKETIITLSKFFNFFDRFLLGFSIGLFKLSSS
jgi:hypothetical protein